jgi:hypothetical protein
VNICDIIIADAENTYNAFSREKLTTSPNIAPFIIFIWIDLCLLKKELQFLHLNVLALESLERNIFVQSK